MAYPGRDEPGQRGYNDQGPRGYDDRGPSRGGYDHRGPPCGGYNGRGPHRGYDNRDPPRRGGYNDRRSPRGGYGDMAPPRNYDRPMTPPHRAYEERSPAGGGYSGGCGPFGDDPQARAPRGFGSSGYGGGGGYDGGRGVGAYASGGRGGSRSGERDCGGFGRVGGRFDHGYNPVGRDALEGTVARPGVRTTLQTRTEADKQMDDFLQAVPRTIAQMGAMPRPTRPGFGVSGRPIKVRANHFPVQCTLKQAIHYDVSIVGVRRSGGAEGVDGPHVQASAGPQEAGNLKPLPADTCRAVIRQLSMQENWPMGIVFDGRKNLYASGLHLPTEPTSFQVEVLDEETNRTRNYIVKIKWATNVDIQVLLAFVAGMGGTDIPQDAIQCLDVALKHGTMLNPLCTPVNRAFFFPDSATTHTLGGGAELWLGYQQSLRPCQDGLALNVDLACTAFLEERPVPEFLFKAAGLYSADQLAEASEMQKKRAAKAVIGIKVMVSHLGARPRAFKVKALTAVGAAQLEFQMEDGRRTTVAEYFEQKYQQRLAYPDCPCLNVGTPRRPIYLPAEVCKIAPGQRRLKLDEKQTGAMIKHAAQKPDQRQWNLERSINEKGGLPIDPHVQAFGLDVGRGMVTVASRILDPPELMYNQKYSPGNNGCWDMRNLKFNRPAILESYGIASFLPAERCGDPHDPASLPTFMFDLLGAMNAVGMVLPATDDLPEIIFHNRNDAFPGETLKRAFDVGAHFFKVPPRIIFVLLPDTGTELYNDIKRASDSYIGVPSQCFVARKANIGVPQARGRPQYCANIAMKVNAKLGGVNCALATIQPFMQRPFMVIGTGVTHPMGYSETEPSIAAVVGSMDAKCSRYSAEVQLQGHRIEIIQELRNIIKRLLLNFYRATGGKKPEKLILYRDGVSEGMFNEVQRAEIPQIVQACRELSEDYAPPLTFVVCQKRHHTRFFPTDRIDTDRSGNCLPGTVIDNSITHPTENDFYLLSHSGIQGTSRPAHYHVLLDQNKFTPDELQLFTYHLTFTFCRCTRSVSMCPPAYYASLAATRGRAMLSRYQPTSDSESVASFSCGPRVGRHAEFANIHRDLSTRMYYV